MHTPPASEVPVRARYPFLSPPAPRSLDGCSRPDTAGAGATGGERGVNVSLCHNTDAALTHTHIYICHTYSYAHLHVLVANHHECAIVAGECAFGRHDVPHATVGLDGVLNQDGRDLHIVSVQDFTGTEMVVCARGGSEKLVHVSI